MAVQRDKIIASAEKLVAKGKVEAAIKEYERLLDDNPNDVNTLNRIGDLWVRINRNDEAVKVFGRIADHYSKDGFFLKAIAIYKKINKLDPSKLDVYAKLADLYAKQGLAMEAKSQYQVLADYYLKHGDPVNALATYRKISELDPNSINVHVKLADLYSQNNQTAEAMKEYDRIGRMLLKRNMLDEAVQVFRKALKIDATNLELIESLVSALFDAKDFQNAQQILDTSLEKNRENPRLLSLLGKAHIGRGDLNAASDVLERGLASNPTDLAIRENLAEVYLRQGAKDRAYELLAPVVDAAVARGEGKVAVDLLNRVLKLDAAHVPALSKLVSVYTKLKQETSVLSAMNSLAEAHISRGQLEDAAGILRDLLQREPANEQHREKLAFVQRQLGGGPEPAPTPAPAPPPPVETAEPMDELSLGIDDGGLELDLSMMPEPEPVAPPRRTASVSPFVAPTPVVEPGEEEEDLDFITEHLTEAEVFAKYGLSEKAIEHCRAVLDRFPRHLPAWEKLLRAEIEDGDADQVRKTAGRYLALLREKGEAAQAASVENDLVTRGFLEQKTPAQAPPAFDEFSSAGAGLVDLEEISPGLDHFVNPVSDVEPAPEELTLDLDAGSDVAEIEFDVDESLMSEPVMEEPAVPIESIEPLPEETFELPAEPVLPELEPLEEIETTFEMPEEAPAEFNLGGDAALEMEPAIEESSLDMGEISMESALDEPGLDLGDLPVEETAPESVAESIPADAFDIAAELPEMSVSEPSFTGASALDDFSAVSLEPSPEELGEIDFYIDQDLLEEARTRVNNLASRFPDHIEVASRLARIDERAEAAAPQEFSAADIENELLTALPDDDDIKIVASPRAAAPSPPVVDESGLFAEEDDFFDLAAELEEELEEEGATVSLSDEEQSLEEIFREFKKGVEQQLDSEDYDTHYNLGIAYKEMGLIDEAVGEFQLASKDPKRTIECCSMLGLCFLEKGMPQLAIKWYLKGLEVPEITEEEHLGLLYDLGAAYLEVGDVPNAQKAFLEIYGANSNYRDIVSRIKQLEDVRN
jgi:pilus assembly protein FimV